MQHYLKFRLEFFKSFECLDASAMHRGCNEPENVREKMQVQLLRVLAFSIDCISTLAPHKSVSVPIKWYYAVILHEAGTTHGKAITNTKDTWSDITTRCKANEISAKWKCIKKEFSFLKLCKWGILWSSAASEGMNEEGGNSHAFGSWFMSWRAKITTPSITR